MTRILLPLALLSLTAAAPKADYRVAAPDTDVTVPITADRTITTSVRGGRTVSIDGKGRRVGRIALYDQAERVEIANLHVVPSGDDDGVDFGSETGTAPDVAIDRVRVTGVGANSGRHPDCFQAQGRVAVLVISNVTCETSYQGLFLKGIPTHTARAVLIRNANFRHAPGTDPKTAGPLIWLFDNGMQRPPVYLINVWVERAPGRPITQLAWPKKGYKNDRGEDISPVIDEKAGTIRWPAAANIHGVVRIGTPPGGDFAK